MASFDLTPDTVPTLDPESRRAVEALVAAAPASDGAAPLSEQALLNLRSEEPDALDSPDGPRHVLVHAAGDLVGYAQVADGAAELVVDPTHRREGVGTRLLEAVAEADPSARVWAHGDVPAAAAFAAARGLEVARELFVLERPLDADHPLDAAVLPEGLVSRVFVPGHDEDEWVRVNAAAFAHHPEQGRLTRDDLEQRMQEPWFDSAGLLLVVDPQAPDTVVAFHWTKVHPAGEKGPRPVGEVYVVGVDPAHQGRGLGRPVTLLGLHHLADAGLEHVILYVDGDNPAALTVYRGLGFSTLGTDRMYARTADADGATMTP